MNFSNVKNITIPNGVVNKITTLEGVVLWERLVLPDVIKPLDYQIFYKTSNDSIIIPTNTTNLLSNEYDEKSGYFVLTYTTNVTRIGESEFQEFTKLTEIILPSTCETIDKCGFSACYALKKVTILAPTISIGLSAFEGCTSLNTIILPQNITYIGNKAFYRCTSLLGIELLDNTTTIVDNAFESCKAMKDVVCYAKVPNYCFYQCTNLTNVELHNDIGERAFDGCGTIENLVLVDGVSKIGKYAFNNDDLKNVDLPSSVTSIGDYAFYGCNLSSLISRNVTAPTIVSNTFSNAFPTQYQSGLPKRSLYVYKNAKGYDVDLWAKTTFILRYLDAPNGDEIIYTSTDDNIVSPNITITTNGIHSNIYSDGKGVIEYAKYISEIPTNLFKNCTTLKSVVLPNTTTSLRVNVFSGCTHLESITCPMTAPTIKSDTFYGIKENGTLYLPQGAKGYGGDWTTYLVNKYNWTIEYITE